MRNAPLNVDDDAVFRAQVREELRERGEHELLADLENFDPSAQRIIKKEFDAWVLEEADRARSAALAKKGRPTATPPQPVLAQSPGKAPVTRHQKRKAFSAAGKRPIDYLDNPDDIAAAKAAGFAVVREDAGRTWFDFQSTGKGKGQKASKAELPSPPSAEAASAPAPTPTAEPTSRQPNAKGRIPSTKTWPTAQEATRAMYAAQKRGQFPPGANPKVVRAKGGGWTISAQADAVKPQAGAGMVESAPSAGKTPAQKAPAGGDPSDFGFTDELDPAPASPDRPAAARLRLARTWGKDAFDNLSVAELVEMAGEAKSRKQWTRLKNIQAEINRRQQGVGPQVQPKKKLESTPEQRAAVPPPAERPAPTDDFGIAPAGPPPKPTHDIPMATKLAVDLARRLRGMGVDAKPGANKIHLPKDVDFSSEKFAFLSEYGVSRGKLIPDRETLPPPPKPQRAPSLRPAPGKKTPEEIDAAKPPALPEGVKLTPDQSRMSPLTSLSEEEFEAMLAAAPENVREALRFQRAASTGREQARAAGETLPETIPSPPKTSFGSTIGEQLAAKGKVVPNVGTPAPKPGTLADTLKASARGGYTKTSEKPLSARDYTEWSLDELLEKFKQLKTAPASRESREQQQAIRREVSRRNEAKVMEGPEVGEIRDRLKLPPAGFSVSEEQVKDRTVLRRQRPDEGAAPAPVRKPSGPKPPAAPPPATASAKPPAKFSSTKYTAYAKALSDADLHRLRAQMSTTPSPNNTARLQIVDAILAERSAATPASEPTRIGRIQRMLGVEKLADASLKDLEDVYEITKNSISPAERKAAEVLKKAIDLKRAELLPGKKRGGPPAARPFEKSGSESRPSASPKVGDRVSFTTPSKGKVEGTVAKVGPGSQTGESVLSIDTDKHGHYIVGARDLDPPATANPVTSHTSDAAPPTASDTVRNAEIARLRAELQKAPPTQQASIRQKLKDLLTPGKREEGSVNFNALFGKEKGSHLPAPPGYTSPKAIADLREKRIAAREREVNPEKPRGLAAIKERWTRLREIFQDSDKRLLDFEDALKRAGVSTRLHAETKATRGGGSGLIEADLHEATKLLDDVEQKNLIQPFLDYLELQGWVHVIGKAEQQAKAGRGAMYRRMLRGKSLPGEQTPGQVEGRLAELKRKLSADDFKTLEAAGKAFSTIINRPLEASVRAGVVSADDVAKWKARGGIYAHQDKLAARAVMSQRERLKALQRAGALSGKAARTLAELEGSILDTKDPLLSTFEKNERIYREAMRSDVVRHAYESMTHPKSPFKDQVRLLKPNEVAEEGSVALTFYDPKTPGKELRAQFSAELGLPLLNTDITPIAVDPIFGPNGIFAWVNKVFKVGALPFSVGWSATNPIRDIRSARAMSRAYDLWDPVDVVKTFMKEFPTAVKDVLAKHPDYLRALRNRELQSTYMKSVFPERYLEHYWNKLSATAAGAPLKTRKDPWHIRVTDFVSALEEATKLMTSRRLWAKGEAPEAIRDEVRNFGGSPDFAVSGEARAGLDTLGVLIAASIQGLTQSLKLIRRKPGRVALLAASATAGILAREAWNSQFVDDDGEPEINHVPRHTRDTSHVVFLPWRVETGDGSSRQMYLSWPKAHVEQLIYTPIESALDSALRGEDPIKGVARSASKLLPVAGELDPKEPIKSLARAVAASGNPLLRIPAELSSNLRMFSGTPITPERLKDVVPEEQYTPFTSPTAVATTNTLRRIGINLGVSPIVVEHILRNVSPGIADQFLNFSDALGAELTGRHPGDPSTMAKLHRTPVAGAIARRFIGPGPMDQVLLDRRERFYTAFDKVIEAAATKNLKARRGERPTIANLDEWLTDDAVSTVASPAFSKQFRRIATDLSRIGRAREQHLFQLMNRENLPSKAKADEIYASLRALAKSEATLLKASDHILRSLNTPGLPKPPAHD